jgi:hypothetical protein
MFKLRLGKIKTGWLRSAPRRRAATLRPRARALGVRARAPAPPDVPPPEVARCPRPTCLPQVGAAPQDASVCPAPRRSIRGPAVRAPAEERRSTATSRLSSSRRHCRASTRPINAPLLPRGRAPSCRPPLPPSCRARPPTSTPSRPTTFPPSLGLAKARALAHCPAESTPRRQPEPPRPPPPAAAARPHRSHLRPNFGHQLVIGELLDEPDPFPGQERRRPRRIPASRTAPHGRGWDCKPQIFPGSFL